MYFAKVAMHIHNVYVHVRNATANSGGFVFVMLYFKIYNSQDHFYESKLIYLGT